MGTGDSGAASSAAKRKKDDTEESMNRRMRQKFKRIRRISSSDSE